MTKQLPRSDPTGAIADRAVEWAVMADYGDMTPLDRAELETWLAADARHRGAFLRARAGLYVAEDEVIQTRALSVTVDRAAAPLAAPVTVSPTVASVLNDEAHDWQRGLVAGGMRRGMVRWNGRAMAASISLAATLAALMALGVPVMSLFRRTDPDAVEQIATLKDGSVARLGKGAKIEVALLPDYRRIRLVSGSATFKVAHDKARPFVVQSGDVYAQATGTVYSVSRVDATGGTVSVSEGSVLVWARDERDQAVLLHAGGELTLKPGPRLQEAHASRPAPRRLPPPEVAQIAFDNEPIRSAAVRFNRVNSTKIVIGDPKIGDLQIVGLFRIDNPERFAQAAAALAGGHVEVRQGKIVIEMQ